MNGSLMLINRDKNYLYYDKITRQKCYNRSVDMIRMVDIHELWYRMHKKTGRLQHHRIGVVIDTWEDLEYDQQEYFEATIGEWLECSTAKEVDKYPEVTNDMYKYSNNIKYKEECDG